jgi:hypothetical protein
VQVFPFVQFSNRARIVRAGGSVKNRLQPQAELACLLEPCGSRRFYKSATRCRFDTIASAGSSEVLRGKGN